MGASISLNIMRERDPPWGKERTRASELYTYFLYCFDKIPHPVPECSGHRGLGSAFAYQPKPILHYLFYNDRF